MTDAVLRCDTNEVEIELVNSPPQSEWRCELFGCGPYGIVWTPTKGNEPNCFWRWMQYLCFGNRWVKARD